MIDVKQAEYEVDDRRVKLLSLEPEDPAAALEAIAKSEKKVEPLTDVGDGGLKVQRDYVGTVILVRKGHWIVGSIDPEENADVTEPLKRLLDIVR